jgi:hypothetical protein
MFRKILLTLAATAAIGASALTPASAGYWGGHHGYRTHFVTPTYYNYGYNYCFNKQIWVDTYYGPVAKWVKVCR